jgi:hypothetical protein
MCRERTSVRELPSQKHGFAGQNPAPPVHGVACDATGLVSSAATTVAARNLSWRVRARGLTRSAFDYDAGAA